MSSKISYKVSLTGGCSRVIFEASSPVTESRSANYDGFNLVHLPTDIWAYRNTTARHFGITGKLVSRNAGEAAANSRNVDLIRSWILPDFGGSGATPPIILFSAYYNTNLTNVQCLIKSYSITFPDDVDWIYDNAKLNAGNTVGSSAMPVVCTIQIDLEEAYTPEQIQQQNWKIKMSKGGTFNYGGSVNDNTGSGGGQYSAQQPIIVTPSVEMCASSKGFAGVASTTAPKTSPFAASNGDMTSAFGVVDSGLLSAVIANPTLVDSLSKMPGAKSSGVILPRQIEGAKLAPFDAARINGIVNYVNSPSQYDDTIAAAATAHGVDPTEIKLVIATEDQSENLNATSTSGAVGLGQFMPATAAQYGITDRTDPTQSINGIAAFLAAHGGTAGNNMAKADMAYIGSGPDARQYVANKQAARLTLQQGSPLTDSQVGGLQIPTPIDN
jgi:hypothetical protein